MFNRCFRFSLLFIVVVFWSSCRKDLTFSPSMGSLEFSKDTIFLDTVFTNISSSTYNLKVYNNSSNAITIPTVSLQNGTSSNYRLNVDGSAGKTFSNVEILPNDSLFVFVETTIDFNSLTTSGNSFLYTDKILFDSGINQQSVDLVTLVKDAIFIFPNRDNTTSMINTVTLEINGITQETEIQGRELTNDELEFTNEKPYVIYGYAVVPKNKTLKINAGARLHFHENSGILVSENASLKIEGMLSANEITLENQVILEGDRLESSFASTAGQWGGILLFENSKNITINYTTINNATIGVLCDGNPNSNKLNISNSQIYNSSLYGILGRNTSITGFNLVLNNSGNASFAGTNGGRYNITHSTIANYWKNSFRQFPSLLINNFVLDDNNTVNVANLNEANFNNCIIYGNNDIELLLDEAENDGGIFNFKFTNCLIKFNDFSNVFTGENYNFNSTLSYENVFLNLEPQFKNTESNMLIIGNQSEAINKGNTTFSNQYPTDIKGISRTNTPDLGAYQHTSFE